jgi:hypothetical protein
MRMPRGLELLLLIGVLWPSYITARPSKDILYFKNGDHWTCEIKKLDQGYLYVGLEYVDGTVSVDWTKIDRIESPQLFVVQDQKGKLISGPLATVTGSEGEPNQLRIGAGPGAATLDRSAVVSIQQIEGSFWQGLHGGFSGGLNYSKANQQTQSNFQANVNYLKQYWQAQADFQSSFSGSISAPSNLRNEFDVQALRMLRSNNYFAIALADFLKSDEQQLDLRSTLGGGIGRMFKNTDRSRFLVVAGADWSRERYTPGTTGTSQFDSIEALLGAQYQYFRFKTTNYSISLFAYPSMTDLGRVRYSGKSTVKYQIIKDLYLNFNIYADYDTRPPRNTTKSDYGASSSLGWTF